MGLTVEFRLDTFCHLFRRHWAARLDTRANKPSMTALNNAVSFALFNKSYSQTVAAQRAGATLMPVYPPPDLHVAAAMYGLDAGAFAHALGMAWHQHMLEAIAPPGKPQPDEPEYLSLPERESAIESLMALLKAPETTRLVVVTGDIYTGMSTTLLEVQRRMGGTGDDRDTLRRARQSTVFYTHSWSVARCLTSTVLTVHSEMFPSRPLLAPSPHWKAALDAVSKKAQDVGIRSFVLDDVGQAFNGTRSPFIEKHYARGLLGASALPFNLVLAGSPHLLRIFDYLPSLRDSAVHIELPPVSCSPALQKWCTAKSASLLGDFTEEMTAGLVAASNGCLGLIGRFVSVSVRAVSFSGVRVDVVRERLAKLVGHVVDDPHLPEHHPQVIDTYIEDGIFAMQA